jgi:hypothetical protein
MITQIQKDRIVYAVNSNPDFADFGIAVEGYGMSQIIKRPLMPPGLGSWIIIKVQEVPLTKNTHSTQKTILPPPPSVIKQRDSHLGKELLDMGINCASTVFAGAVLATGVLAAPATGGGSVALSVLAWTAYGASAIQCGVGLGRVGNELKGNSRNQRLDNNSTYQQVMYGLDAVQLIDVAVNAVKIVKISGKFVNFSTHAQDSLKKVYTGFNRAERKLLARELSNAASNAEFKRLVRSGTLNKVLTMRQIQWTAATTLMDSLGAALSLLSSSRGGNVEYLINLASEAEIK